MPHFLPNLNYTTKLVMLLLSAVILLRLSGKRSIAQLTVPEAVLMIAIGTLLIQPVASKSEWIAVYGAATLVIGMIILSYIEIFFPRSRKLLYGVPSVLVKEGKIDVAELKRVKMNEDQLEMRIRQLQIGNVSDIKLAVLEPSGNLSVVQKENKKAAQKEDIQKVLDELKSLREEIQMGKGKGSSPFDIQSLHQQSITSPKRDLLFEEALKEDQQDNNITTH